MSELELTDIEKAKRVEEARLATNQILKENYEKGHVLARETYKNVMNEFAKIEEKNRCLRVRFLDWLSDKFLSYSHKLHEMSTRISNPCAIKLPEDKSVYTSLFVRNGNTKPHKTK